MRAAAASPSLLAIALVAALVAAAPTGAADQEQDSTIGLNLGFVAPGVWDIFAFHADGGPTTITLYWAEPALFPFADYDLRLYRPNAMANNELSDGEMMAQSSQHPYAHHGERIDIALAPGTYYVAVVPFQAQLEEYTLGADPGGLDLYASAFGYVTFEP